MSATSSDLQLDNEKGSLDSFSSHIKGGNEKDRKNTSNWENGKKSSSDSKSDPRSLSSQYDDKSEHFERLLRETRQHVSNRDALIEMLQKQLKRIEELYKKTLNQQQDIRQKYANVVLELSRLRVICDKLKTENSALSRTSEENTKRYRYEKESLQEELDTWRNEYDQLLRAINNMEKNTVVMKDLLYSGNNGHHQQILNGNHMERLIEQYNQIQGALVMQNDKLDKFLEKFHLIGDGGCSIVKSLEGIRCIGKALSRSLSSIVLERPKSFKDPEQVLIPPVRRLDSRRRTETPLTPSYFPDYPDPRVSIRSYDKRPLKKIDEITQTDSYSEICCVNLAPMLLESRRPTNAIPNYYEESSVFSERTLKVPEKFAQTKFVREARVNERLQTDSCSTSEASCSSEVISAAITTTTGLQTGPSCESICSSQSCRVSEVIPPPVLTVDLAATPGSIRESVGSIPQERPSPSSQICSDVGITPALPISAEVAAQTLSICESTQKEVPPASDSYRDTTSIVPVKTTGSTESISQNIDGVSKRKLSSGEQSCCLSEIKPPHKMLKTRNGLYQASMDSLPQEKLPSITRDSRDSKVVSISVNSAKTGDTSGSSFESIRSFPQRKLPSRSYSHDSEVPASSIVSEGAADKVKSRKVLQKRPPTGMHTRRVPRLEASRESATQTESMYEDICEASQERQSPSSHGHYDTKVIQTVDQGGSEQKHTRKKPVKPPIMETCWFGKKPFEGVESVSDSICSVTHETPTSPKIKLCSTTIETGTSPHLHINFLPEELPHATVEKASQTESSCRDSCTLSEKVPPTTIEVTTQTEPVDMGSCILPEVIFPPATVEEASQTASIIQGSYVVPEIIPHATVEETTQTISIGQTTVGTSVACLHHVCLPGVKPPLTAEETTQTASIGPITAETGTSTLSICSEHFPGIKPPLTAEETTQTSSVAQMTVGTGTSVSCLHNVCLPGVKPPLTVEETIQTVSIGQMTVETGTSPLSIDSEYFPGVKLPLTVEETTQTASIRQMTVETGTSVSSLHDECFSDVKPPLTVEETTQTSSIGQMTVETGTSALSIQSEYYPGIKPLLSVEETTQTYSIGQMTVETSTSPLSINAEYFPGVKPPLTAEKTTQTASIEQITTETSSSASSLICGTIPPTTAEEAVQTISIGLITTDTGTSVPSLISGFLPGMIPPVTAEASVQTSIGQMISEPRISVSSLINDLLPGIVPPITVATQIESIRGSTCTIPEVIPPPLSIGEVAQTAASTPSQQCQSVCALPETKDEVTQIEISSVCKSIQTEGDYHHLGVTVETQTTEDKSTQTLNLECTDCCTETEVFKEHLNRKFVTCRKHSKFNEISGEASADCCDEEELRTCCFCDDISLMVKPESTDKGISTEYFDSGDGGLLAENERLHQLLLEKDLIIIKVKEEVLVEKKKLQETNVALKQDLATMETEVEWLKKKLADVEHQTGAFENGKEHYISETNVLLNEYEASLQELNQKYTTVVTENQALTEEVALLTEQVNFLGETIKQHKEQASICKVQLENMTEKAKELEDTIEELEEQKEFVPTTCDDVAELNTALQELTDRYELLKEENESLMESNKEITLLKKKNSNLVHEMDAKDVLVNELQDHVADLQKELDSIREEMERNNETTKEEMDQLMQACMELEQKLEMSKEILEKEVSLMDEEVNTSLVLSCDHVNESLQNELDERTNQLQKVKQELEDAKANFEEEISKLEAKNALLQLQFENEQAEHQREIDLIEDKLAQCHKEYVSTIVSCSDIASSDSSTTSSELTSLLEECVEKNRKLHEELKTCREQMQALQESGKECGLLKTENMKLKMQISTLQKQLAELKDVHEKLMQLNQEKEELMVKVNYLEKQLSISRCKCERVKRPPPCLEPIKEETIQRPCAVQPPKPKVSCYCSEKKDHIRITLTTPCDDKVNKDSPTDPDGTVWCKDPQLSGALGNLNLRLASINRMEGQVDHMIMSVHRQTQKMNKCSLPKCQLNKDINECITNLRQKREQLMGSLNKFKQELAVFESRTKARMCNYPKRGSNLSNK
ncbi:hypothetical protein Trydic_g21270 [Trypoxylus dichotomus]